jgi:hypothetical protein
MTRKETDKIARNETQEDEIENKEELRRRP